MDEKIESPHNNHTWKLITLPKGQKVVGCKWVFKKKNSTPRVESPQYKVWLIAKGFTYREEIDFIEVFFLLMKHSSIRALFAMVAPHDLELKQLHVKTLFMHGEVEKKIYICQPKRFVIPSMENLVYLLKSSFYDLKQSLRQWYKRYDTVLEVWYIRG